MTWHRKGLRTPFADQISIFDQLSIVCDQLCVFALRVMLRARTAKFHRYAQV